MKQTTVLSKFTLSVFLIASLLPVNANARDYGPALEAVKIAAYKQSGAEAFTQRLQTYVVNQIPYNRVLASGFGAYKMVQARELRLNLSNGKSLTIGQYFSSITLRF